jgi:hypothetical protein
MKTRFTLSILLLLALCPLPPAFGQVPQGINYQAIARDINGDPIAGKTMQVRLGILSDTLVPVTVWEELHSTVKTNAFGLFTVVLGKGVKQSGSAPTFADIDWTKTPLWLSTWIYYPSSWKYLGTSKIWSVPYSLTAGGLDGALEKLEVIGDDVSSDEALFEVKRKDGQTMFAVYNHGVRVFMPLDTLSKARKGGFAIGGFSKAKGTIQDYFVVNPDSIRAYIDPNSAKARKGGFAIGSFSKAKDDIQKYFTVSPDSVRIYIDENLSKARKGGFAIGGFDKAKAGNANFFNVAPDSTGQILSSQNRIQWYPLKNAFLTGRIIAENRDSVGENSFASGYESRSKGQYSQALGYKAIARGDYSTAIGKNAIANKKNTFAFGEDAKAINEEGYALGRGAVASGYRSFAFGSAGLDKDGYVTDFARALGDYSFSIGQGSRSTGKGAFCIGIADTASGDYSVALGHLASSRGDYAAAIGLYSFASGERSTSIGYQSIAKGAASTALGSYAKAIENYSVAIGYETNATGFNATAIGCKAIASGWISSSIGFETNSKGTISTAIGYRTIAAGDFSTSLGKHTLAKPLSSLAIGQYNDTTCSSSGLEEWVTTDPIFVIGNGTSDEERSNAITVLKNGNVGIATVNPTQKLEITGTNSKIFLNSSISNSVHFNTYGNAPPAFTTRSNGSKLILYPSISSTYVDFAIGIDINTFWYSIPSASSTFSYKFYAGTTELVRISGNGNVGIGASTPAYKLQIGNAGDGSQARANAWNLLSDARYKTNLVRVEDAIPMLESINGYYFNWNTGTDKSRQIGLLAQEVEVVLPEVVSKGEDGILSIDYGKLAPLLLEAIKEQQQQIEAGKQENNQLRSEVQSLREEIEQIRAVLMGGNR